ncbi:MAG: shikimate kinase [Chloroflexaceae bacterium]|nr:shikimate kinase [Chloroflexaceae bacterium]
MSMLPRPIALVGLSGTGKSTVAAVLAQRLGWPSFDTDALIVQFSGGPVADLFATRGEDYFRTLETEILGAALLCAAFRPAVLATGGGIVLREDNRMLLQQGAFTIWLDAPTDVLLARLLAHTEERPLLKGDNPAARLDTLRQQREPLYRAVADLVIDTAGLAPEAISAMIWGQVMRGA